MNYIDLWKFQHLKCYQTYFVFVIIDVITYMLYLDVLIMAKFELSPIYFDSNTEALTEG